MSRRLRRCLSEEDRIDKRIAELQSQKADLEVVRAQEEEKEIIRAIRSMKLEKHELADLLEGLKSGEVSLLRSDDFEDEDEDENEKEDGNENGSTEGYGEMMGASDGSFGREDAPEEEADYGGQTNA